METPQGSRFTRLGWRFRAHGEGAEMAMGMGVQASTRLPIPVGDSPYSKVFAQNFVSASLSEVTVQRQHGRPVCVANGISLKP